MSWLVKLLYTPYISRTDIFYDFGLGGEIRDGLISQFLEICDGLISQFLRCFHTINSYIY